MDWPSTREGEQLGPIQDAVDAALADLVERRTVERIWSGDHTLWQDDPTEVADRLGWLGIADEVAADQAVLAGFAREVAADGLTHALVMGMGGSSLFPEVVASTFAARAEGLQLRVLDTTDVGAIRAAEA